MTGELANRIMHPASHINKVYRVTVRPDITDEQAAELSAGVKIGENTTTLPATVIVLEKQPRPRGAANHHQRGEKPGRSAGCARPWGWRWCA